MAETAEGIDLTEYDGLSGRSPVPFKIHMTLRHNQVLEVIEKADDADSSVKV